MKNPLKKTMTALMITAALVSSFVPRTSHAAVGIGMLLFGGAGIPAIVIGGTFTAIGLGMDLTSGSGFAGFVDAAEGLSLAFTGLVVLDTKDQQGVLFAALDDKATTNLKISPVEAAAYNSELDEVNAVRDEVTARLLESKKPTMELSNETWNELKTQISPEAYSVVQKISQHMLDVAHAAK